MAVAGLLTQDEPGALPRVVDHDEVRVQAADDARQALDRGMDGVVVSNHGGRQVDGEIGALEALRQEGRAGDVPVTGIDGTEAALSAIEAGEMAGTVAWDPVWTGGMGLSLCHAVATGALDIAAEPPEHREFYGTGIVVTASSLTA